MPRHESKTLSTKNEYYLSRNKYLELYYFCRQYDDWKKEYESLGSVQAFRYEEKIKSPDPSDPTFNIAARRLELFHKMELVEQTAIEANPELARFILMNVTEGAGFNYIDNRFIVPCCEKSFYKFRRRFFFLLARKR